MAVDPALSKYYSHSPYIYCANNPLKFVDPDGENAVATAATIGGTLMAIPGLQLAGAAVLGAAAGIAIGEYVVRPYLEKRGRQKPTVPAPPRNTKPLDNTEAAPGSDKPVPADAPPEVLPNGPFPHGPLKPPTGSPTGSDKPPTGSDPNLVPQPPTIGPAGVVTNGDNSMGQNETQTTSGDLTSSQKQTTTTERKKKEDE